MWFGKSNVGVSETSFLCLSPLFSFVQFQLAELSLSIIESLSFYSEILVKDSEKYVWVILKSQCLLEINFNSLIDRKNCG